MLKTGVDLVSIERIGRVFGAFGSKFSNRILHPRELERLESIGLKKECFLAKRFAIKEAISKAFGVGIGRDLSFKDIVIVNDSRGAPQVEIEQKRLANLTAGAGCQISISVSDDCNMVVACAVILLNERETYIKPC